MVNDQALEIMIESGFRRASSKRPVGPGPNDGRAAHAGDRRAAGQFTDFRGDQADRMIYATAITNSAPLVTNDRRLRDHADRVADVTAVW